jgi:sec-independent protein translocase protein TatA
MFGLLPFNVGPWELILVLVILFIILGPGKLPEVGRSLGRGIKEFRKSSEQKAEAAIEEENKAK